LSTKTQRRIYSMTTTTTVPLYVQNVFTDPGWQRYGHNLYFKEVDGKKVGIVGATMSSRDAQYLLNKKEFDRPLNALAAGKIDAAWVVGAGSNGTGQYKYRGGVEIRQFWETVLKDRSTNHGRYGDFWIVEWHELEDEDSRPF
jgi:hypothetical protein